MYYVYCTVLYMDVIMLFYKTKFYKVERDKGVYTVVYNVYCIMYMAQLLQVTKALERCQRFKTKKSAKHHIFKIGQ